jgi:3-hydroxyacyl-CoA dehydrogenase
MDLTGVPVLVAGAGAMGVGIAQVAAQAGHLVYLYDVRAGAEVVSGLHTDRAVADAVLALCQAWGKVPVHARSTPGFIVNRIARPYYGETWALLQEQAAPPQTIDACMRAAGFRMGPCALMDLIGHDINFAVVRTLAEAGYAPQRCEGDDFVGLSVNGTRLWMTDGRPATKLSLDLDESEVAIFDWPVADASHRQALAFSMSTRASPAWAVQARQWLHVLGYLPRQVADAPALIVARTLSMIVNEAADAVLQGVCSEPAADAAMTLGVNYPAGPFEWLARLGASNVVAVIDNLDAHYRGERYRTSAALRRRAWATSPQRSSA